MFTVIPILSKSFSASFPVISLLFKSTRIKWLSLPLDTNLKSYFTNYKNGEIVHFRVISPDGFTVFEDKRFCNEEFCKHYIDIENPQLWYPNGYGNQPLYKLEITVKDIVEYIDSQKA